MISREKQQQQQIQVPAYQWTSSFSILTVPNQVRRPHRLFETFNRYPLAAIFHESKTAKSLDNISTRQPTVYEISIGSEYESISSKTQYTTEYNR